MYIKDEPVEPTEEANYHQNNDFDYSSTANIISIDDQFDTELVYLNNICENVFNLNEEDENLLKDFHSNKTDIQNTDIIGKCNDGLLSQVLLKSDRFLENEKREKLVEKDSTSNSSLIENNVSSNKANNSFKKEQLVLEKKKVLMAILESSRNQDSIDELDEPLSLIDEKRILNQLVQILNQSESEGESEKNKQSDKITALRRLKCKLELRNLKRKKRQKLFDIDSYVNELIDRERFSFKKTLGEFSANPEENNLRQNKELANNHDNDVIFEKETLKTSFDSNGGSSCQIIAIKQVLDRFNIAVKADVYDQSERHTFFMPIGFIVIRNEDVKCLISPLTNKYQIDYFLFVYY